MTLSQFPLGNLCINEVCRYPTYYNIEYLDTGVPEIRGPSYSRMMGTSNLDKES